MMSATPPAGYASPVGALQQIDTDLQNLIRTLSKLIESGNLTAGQIVAIAQGGTGANNVANARANLGLGSAATKAASNTGDTNLASVNLPVTAGHLAAFGDTNGTLADGGAPSSLSYATGTWTPALELGGGSTGLTYTTRAGSYTQIGREIVCRFTFTINALGSSTGAATIAGLPFTSSADATNAGAGGILVTWAGMSGLSQTPIIQVGSAVTAVGLFLPSAATPHALQDTNFAGGAMIAGYFSYFT